MAEDFTASWKDELPLIPLRNMVVFPQMIVPLFIGRSKSVKALEDTLAKERMVVFASQQDEEIEDPAPKDIRSMGTLAEVVQMMNLPDGTTKILVEGITRVKIESYLQESPYYRVRISKIAEVEESGPDVEAQVRLVIKQFENYVKLNKRIPSETLMSIINVENPSHLADLIASYLVLKVQDKQELFEAPSALMRLKKLSEILNKEVEVLEVEKKLQGRVRRQIEKVQKEYYLKEKLRAIQDELGNIEEEPSSPEVKEYKDKIEAAKLAPEAKEKALKELDRLSKMPPVVAEAAVIRTYLDWLIELPWSKKSRSRIDLQEVKETLDADHFGLEKVKERITEHFAVLKLTKQNQGVILCLLGPPGVGKTSVASSIASALGRKFVRIALGGVRDEAEIRGHRRTYVGSLPGRIIQSLHKCKVKNPVFLLDEVDKMSADFRGDPSAALLEVLDPEQNKHFSDHYLEVPFDLSNVLFIATANTIDPIPKPLRDRMEIIRMAGYTEAEKLGIATRHLIAKTMKKNGLKPSQLSFSDESITRIIQLYTKEAGVRNMERQIATICRKVATNLVQGKKSEVQIEQENLQTYLGAPKFRFGQMEQTDQVGTATGLVWTEMGGDSIPIEVTVMKGKGELTLTGQLGDVMQESAKAAMSYVRSQADQLDLEEGFNRKIDIHIHVPEGAVPKDGPSAGITLATAIVSAVTGIPVRRDVAMTGEVTLRGRVLPIGGLKEKVLAAHRAGIRKVLFPKENEKDLDEITKEIDIDLEFVAVEDVGQVLREALVTLPKAMQPKTKAREQEVRPPGKRGRSHYRSTSLEGGQAFAS